MTTRDDVKKMVLEALESLPEPALEDVLNFLEYQQYKLGKKKAGAAPYNPVALGGLWDGMTVRDEDIRDVRREMWEQFRDEALSGQTRKSSVPTNKESDR
jgi:hypothetical protein